MEVRFEDHGGFQRAAALAAVGGGALAAVAPQLAAVAAAGTGSRVRPGVRRRADGGGPRAQAGGGRAAARLHVAVGGDEVESRLASLRASLGPDLRPLAERAAAARRGATDELPGGARADLRTLLDSLALAALDFAARAADLGRSAPAALEEDLQRRCAQLTQSAASAADPAAQKSYLRAADALQR